MPSIRELEYIVAVDRHRHFGRAAKACHISQPTLSMQIQKVEDELNLTIFDRLKKPIVPTARGRKLIEQAKVILREQAKLLQMSKEEGAEPSGDFRLGVIPTIAPYLVPLFVETFTRTYPKIRLKIEELTTARIIDALRQDLIDGGILATPLHESGLKERPLYYEPFQLYVEKNHPLAKRKLIREDDLDASDMWLLQDGHCFRTQVVRFCSLPAGKTGIFRNLSFEAGSLETLRNLIRSGHGYTLVPYLFSEELSAEERRENIRPFATPVPTREVSLIFRHDQWRAGILEAIEKSIIASVPAAIRERGEKQTVLEVK